MNGIGFLLNLREMDSTCFITHVIGNRILESIKNKKLLKAAEFTVHTVGHGCALVESIAFNRKVVGSTPALAATCGPWASPLSAVACALRRETPIQYPCCSRERL